MTRMLSLLAYLLTLLAPCAIFAQDAHFENRVIEEVNVVFIKEGTDTTYDGIQILSRIKTAEGGLFSQTEFDDDLKTLALEYDHVEPDIETVGPNLRITLRVWPKPTIRSIQWQGTCKVERAKLQEELGICPGTLFERHAFNQAFHKLKAYYVKKGYFEAQLDYAVEVDPCSNCVDIAICVEEGRSGRIKEISFRGFTDCEESALCGMISTKTYNVFLSWLTGSGTYNEEMIQLDEYRILNYMQNLGYADAQIDIEVCEAECDRIIIYISVDRGELYYLGDISFEGNCLYSDERIEDTICIEEGDVYSPEALRDTVGALQDAYGRCGYIDAVVDFEATLREEECAYDIHFNIEEGDQYRIGLIRVIGNTCTQTRVILHESLLVPGEIFNIEKLKATEARLCNIGYFKNVNVYPAQPNELLGEDCNFRDVLIEVEETGTGNFSAFGGYSTAESLFGGFTITEKNFNYRGLSKCWKEGAHHLRGAGEFLSFTLNVGLKSQSYVLSWTEPHFRDTPWSIGFDIDRSSNHYVSDDYTIKATGLAVHAGYPLGTFLRFNWHYRIRNTDVEVNGEPTTQLEETAHNRGLISASGIDFVLDSTNSPMCPTKGIRSRLQFEYGGIGGDHHFWSMGYMNTYYHPVCDNGVLKLRADMRYISPIGGTTPDTMPLDERLFLGGDNGVRGFRPYAIGPKFPDTTDPKGGMSLQLLSAEYNHKLLSRLDGFLFFDAGALSFRTWHVDTLRSSAGVGIRFQLLESGPPVTMGVGFPVNPRSRSDVRQFFWSLGGRF